jgi:hypothetical protein
VRAIARHVRSTDRLAKATAHRARATDRRVNSTGLGARATGHRVKVIGEARGTKADARSGGGPASRRS